MSDLNRTNYERAQSLLESGTGTTEGRALAYAVLALADAVAAAEFPALEIKKDGLGLSAKFRITPIPARRVRRAA